MGKKYATKGMFAKGAHPTTLACIERRAVGVTASACHQVKAASAQGLRAVVAFLDPSER
jgi:hypothetical protein